MVQNASPLRMTLHHPGSPILCSIYTVEFGNLKDWTEREQEALRKEFRRRMGPKSSVEVKPTTLAGRKAYAVSLRASRQGHPWGLEAVFAVHGGQAVVFETLFPESERAKAQEIQARLLGSVAWCQPERG